MKHGGKNIILALFLLACLCLPGGIAFAANQPLNINTATAAQLEQIKGIGPKTAEKIVTYRKEHGKFKSVQQLCAVKGIGEKSIAKMADKLCVK